MSGAGPVEMSTVILIVVGPVRAGGLPGIGAGAVIGPSDSLGGGTIKEQKNSHRITIMFYCWFREMHRLAISTFGRLGNMTLHGLNSNAPNHNFNAIPSLVVRDAVRFCFSAFPLVHFWIFFWLNVFFALISKVMYVWEFCCTYVIEVAPSSKGVGIG